MQAATSNSSSGDGSSVSGGGGGGSLCVEEVPFYVPADFASTDLSRGELRGVLYVPSRSAKDGGERTREEEEAEEGEKIRPLLLLCHGMCCTRKTRLITDLVEACLRHARAHIADMIVGAFDFSGNGESEGEWRYAGYAREVDDLYRVVAWLESEHADGEAAALPRCKVCGLLGHSKGAAAVAHFMCNYRPEPDEPMCVVLLAGRFIMDEFPASRFSAEQMEDLRTKGAFTWQLGTKELRITQEDVDERAAVDHQLLSSVAANVTFLVIHGVEDATIGVDDAHRWADVCATTCVHTVAGAGHFFKESDEFVPQIAQWVTQAMHCILTDQPVPDPANEAEQPV